MRLDTVGLATWLEAVDAEFVEGTEVCVKTSPTPTVAEKTITIKDLRRSNLIP
jgi:hypothetical protein